MGTGVKPAFRFLLLTEQLGAHARDQINYN